MDTSKLTDKQINALRRSRTGDSWYWPRGHDVLVLRRLVRLGLLRETRGECEGCASHRSGTVVPVFQELG